MLKTSLHQHMRSVFRIDKVHPIPQVFCVVIAERQLGRIDSSVQFGVLTGSIAVRNALRSEMNHLIWGDWFPGIIVICRSCGWVTYAVWIGVRWTMKNMVNRCSSCGHDSMVRRRRW